MSRSDKYQLYPFLKAAAELSGAPVPEMSPLQVERLCCQGELVGWDWVLSQWANACGKRTTTSDFSEWRDWRPARGIGAFERGNRGPTGHLVEFMELVFGSNWLWSATVAQGTSRSLVTNHWAVRIFYDLVHRNQFGRSPASYNMLAGPKSCGKTATAVMYALTMFLIFRSSMTVRVCSTTASGSEGRVFGQLKDFWRRCIYSREPDIAGDGEFRLIDSNAKRLIYCPRGADDKIIKNTLTGIELVAIKRGADGESATNSLIGIKAPLKLLIVDEANGVDDSIFAPELHSNWMEAEHGAQMVFMLNPTPRHRKSVQFYKPEGGWTGNPDYEQESPGWQTERGGYVTNLCGLDTPNGQWRHKKDPSKAPSAPSAPFPFLLTRTSIEKDIRDFGEGSAAFSRMTVGFLCDEEKTDTILTPRMIEESGAGAGVKWTGDGTFPLLGIDPAFGGDKFAIYQGQIGYGYHETGRKVFLEVGKLRYVPFIPNLRGTPEQAQVSFVEALANQLGIGPKCIAADATGTSTGFVYPLEKALRGQIHRVVFSAAASQRLSEPGSNKPSKLAFVNMSSELAYSVRVWLPFIRGLNDEKTLDQACDRTFEVRPGNKIAVEIKKDFAIRTGGSPDEFDALAILVDIAREMGLGTETLRHPQAASIGGVIQRRRFVPSYGLSAIALSFE